MIRKLSYDTLCKLSLLALLVVLIIYVDWRFVPSGSFKFAMSSLFEGGFLIFIIALIPIYEVANAPEEFVFHCLCLTGALLAVGVLYAYVAPYTPHAPIDPLLVSFDKYLGINVVEIVRWSLGFPILRSLCLFAYNTLFVQVIMVMVVLALLGEREMARRYVLAIFIGYVGGAIFYYFWPSLDPSYSYIAIKATEAQRQIIEQFYLTHHHQHLYFHNFAFISFPSFHIFWAMCATYYTRRRPVLFYALVFINIFLIPATLISGWHYVADVIGGVVYCGLVILISECASRFFNKRNPQQVHASKSLLQTNLARATPAWDIGLQILSIVVLLLTTYFQQSLIFIGFYVAVLYQALLWRQNNT